MSRREDAVNCFEESSLEIKKKTYFLFEVPTFRDLLVGLLIHLLPVLDESLFHFFPISGGKLKNRSSISTSNKIMKSKSC